MLIYLNSKPLSWNIYIYIYVGYKSWSATCLLIKYSLVSCDHYLTPFYEVNLEKIFICKRAKLFSYGIFAEDFTKPYGYSKIVMTDDFCTLAFTKFLNSAKSSCKV